MLVMMMIRSLSNPDARCAVYNKRPSDRYTERSANSASSLKRSKPWGQNLTYLWSASRLLLARRSGKGDPRLVLHNNEVRSTFVFSDSGQRLIVHQPSRDEQRRWFE